MFLRLTGSQLRTRSNSTVGLVAQTLEPPHSIQRTAPKTKASRKTAMTSETTPISFRRRVPHADDAMETGRA